MGKKVKKSPGRPSEAKRRNPKFKGQYATTVEGGTKTMVGTPKQVNFRCPPETEAMIGELGSTFGLSDTDVIKLSLVFAQRNLALLQENLDARALSFMAQPSQDAVRFERFLRKSVATTMEGALLGVLSDFTTIRQIGDQEVRNGALEGLREKVIAIFDQATAPKLLPPTEQEHTKL